jgi:hypothetical protein
MKVLLEPDGELRCANTLSLVGHWFKVDQTIYYLPLSYE